MDRQSQTDRLTFWAAVSTEHYARRFNRLMDTFQDLSEAFACARAGKADSFRFLPDRTVDRLMAAAGEGYLDALLDQLDKKEIGVCLRTDETYPPLLKKIPDAPSLLYYRGKLPACWQPAIAVVGARTPTEYGKEMAKVFSYSFVKNGVTVVSGMAAGVDACAARGALTDENAPFPTVAVLGSGVDVIYPGENRGLYQQILSRGAVISEFAPGTPPARENFPIRNRIISGMSLGVLVVEARERSGTFITAGFALEEGREVFAIPGRITDRLSVGTNCMIQRGEAKPVFCPEDVLNEIGVNPQPALEKENSLPLSSLSPVCREIWRLLKTGDQTIDQLCERLKLPAGSVNSGLTELLFSGIMKQLPGRVYSLDPSGPAIMDDMVNGGTKTDV